jgi:acyl-CoA synthetase (AMP-forming)/AMP-acid ligase II
LFDFSFPWPVKWPRLFHWAALQLLFYLDVHLYHSDFSFQLSQFQLLTGSSMPPIQTIQPATLGDLFPVFDRLEAGESIALTNGQDIRKVLTIPEGPGPWLGVQSSGSTGRPKLLWRPWTGLKQEVRDHSTVRGWTWASPFCAASFAGVQVALQTYVTRGNVVDLAVDWPGNWRRLIREKVDAVSCTPTFLDLLIQNEEATSRGYHPVHITLGGEPLRASLGSRLRCRFAQTSFMVVYAAAEFGVLLKTHRLDGWYELQALNKRYPGWRLSEQAELEICQAGHWRGTGDRVELQSGLARVTGRCDDVANVGGTKVSLTQVAELAEQVPGVRRAFAVAEDNAVTGQIVALHFAVEPGGNPDEIQARLEASLRQQLRKEAWPRQWIRDEVGLGPNAKREVNHE